MYGCYSHHPDPAAGCAHRLVEEEGVGTIFCLQEDHDAEYFGFSIADITVRADRAGASMPPRWSCQTG